MYHLFSTTVFHVNLNNHIVKVEQIDAVYKQTKSAIYYKENNSSALHFKSV